MNRKNTAFSWKRYQKPLLMIGAGVILMICGKNLTGEENPITTQLGGETSSPLSYESTISQKSTSVLEQEIEELLCAISGVKQAHVVITYENSGEQQVEKDVVSQTEQTQEEDGAGGNRVIMNGQNQEETVYVEDAEGNKYPFIKTETYGTVRGVAVVVNGTYNESIREKIVRTLEVLLDVPTHKIQVIW